MIARISLILVGLAIMFALPVVAMLTQSHSYHGLLIEERAPEFHLSQLNQEGITLNDFQDKPVYMSFGYTHCTHTCPIQLNALQKLQEKVGNQAHFLWISLDPQGDNQEALAALEKTGMKILLPSSKKAAKQLAQAYKNNVSYKQGKLDYIQHNSHIYLINNNQLIMLYQGSTIKSEQLAYDFQQLFHI